MTSRWRFLIGSVTLGCGLTLFALGFESHTTEALPFGIIITLAGVAISWKPWRALRSLQRETEAVSFIGGEIADGLPTTVQCAGCGGSSPLRLDTPDRSDCKYCGQRTLLSTGLTTKLTAASAAVKAQDAAERQVAEIIASLPEKERALTSRLGWTIAVLAALGGLAVLTGVLQLQKSNWVGFVSFGLMASMTALILGSRARKRVSSLVIGLAGHWTALPAASNTDFSLRCRVCGAPLLSLVKPLLKCDYCEADNLASPPLLARVEALAAYTVRSLKSISRRNRETDEESAYIILSLPAFVIVAWFAIGAFAGGLGMRLLSDVRIGPDDAANYVVVDGCIGVIEGDAVRFSASEVRKVSSMPAPVPISHFIGKRLRDKGRLIAITRSLGFLERHEGVFEYESIHKPGEVIFPGRGGFGETICLEK